MDFQLLPLPPPWIEALDKDLNKIYVNDVTGEATQEHPYLLILQKKIEKLPLIETVEAENKKLNMNTTATTTNTTTANNNNNINDNSDNNMIDEMKINDTYHFGSNLSVVDEIPINDSTVTSTSFNFLPINTYEGIITKPHKSIKYIDFRCEWKESNLMGDIQAYGLRVRYYENQNTLIKMDGIEGEWISTVLEGPYGPVNEYDLYIGAKIKIFGRHLTISSASASVCHKIEVKAKKMEKRIKNMQTRIENVGVVPILRREAPTTTRHITRGGKAEGHANLRKLMIDVTKLAEQMQELGLPL